MLAPDPPPYTALPQPPPQLRQARSACNLRDAHGRPGTAVADRRGEREQPVDFVTSGLPTPPMLSPAPSNEIRRVKSSSALSASTEPPPSKPQSRWDAALGEAQYLAGGLLSRPVESTRHYSIIRHSHALVWYRGPATSVTITVLADTELPAGRTLWLQQKGYSGNVGMSLKALVGTTGNWLNVTPETRAGSEDLPDVDERGIQRDLRRFSKKASGRQRKHVPRETHVARIPAAATDGYFRLVLCADEEGKKVLCGCPVFRVASTSTDASVVRGASVRTMPLEVGVKVGTTVAQQFAKRYTGPAAVVVESRAAKVVSSKVAKRAVTVGQTVVQTTGIDNAVAESWKRGKAGRYEPVVHETSISVVGPDSGPEEPFPLAFDGKVGRGTGRSTAELGIPTANLHGVRDEVKMRWKGVYAAWACVAPAKGVDHVSHDWHEAVVTIGPLRHAPPEVVLKNRVTVSLIHDFEDASLYDMRVHVILMGHMHPPLPRDAHPQDVVTQHADDTMTVLASLGRDSWSVDSAARRRNLSERLDGVTGSVQGRVDRIPLHWAGVRSESGALRDKVYGNGGIWIRR